MNKHGQTLILFVILLPVLLLFASLVIDTGVLVSKKVQVKEIIKEGIKEVLEDNQNKDTIKLLLDKNNINVTKLEITYLDNKLEVKNEIEVDSIFATIVGIKKHTIKTDIIGYRKNNKVIFE